MKKLLPSMAVALALFWVQPVMAYIDPGSGSAIMSALIGFFVAIGLAIKTYWYKLKFLFTGKSGGKSRQSDFPGEDK